MQENEIITGEGLSAQPLQEEIPQLTVSQEEQVAEEDMPLTELPQPAVENRDWEAFNKRLDEYIRMEENRILQRELARVQAIDPTITSFDDLPPEYVAIRFNGIVPMDAKATFAAVQAIKAHNKKPPSTGVLAGGSAPEKEYYTGEELNRLTKAQLSDPAVMEKAMKSLAMLK